MEFPLIDEPLKLKLCSWAEEEVDFDGADRAFGFLGKPVSAPSESSTSSRSSCSSSADPGRRPTALFPAGALLPIHCRSKQSVVGSVYALDSQAVGRGSYGEVMSATHRRTGARRAVKFIAKARLQCYVEDPSAFIMREVDILRRVDHPNIVRMYEAFEDDGMVCIVLELCEGGDLLERVTVAHDRMPELVAAALLTQMLSAVEHLWHRGIVHRDLKPENFLFVRREPEHEPMPPVLAPVKLIDFGLSRRLTRGVGARVTPKIGTAEYMAPEAYTGLTRPALADRMDVWSLGVVLHVIFIGHFPSPHLAELSMDEYLALPCWEHISPAGREFLGSLLHADPARRPSVTAALQHPWIAAASTALGEAPARLARGLPATLQAYTRWSDFRRLALAATAREVDESELADLRSLFYALLAACGGALTRPALQSAVAQKLPQPLAAVAMELGRRFEMLDTDGSGTLEWSELVAPVLGNCGDAALPECLVPPTDGECHRAFDLLSQGSSSVSAASLHILFASTGGSGDGVVGSHVQHPLTTISADRDELRRIVCDVDAKGSIDARSFLALVRD